MGILRNGHSIGTHIAISPAPDLYAVDFEINHNLGVSVIIPATCALSAKLRAWELFPEHKRRASATHVHTVEYVEIDWQTGRSIVAKRQKRPTLPKLLAEEPNEELSNDWHSEEGAQ